MRCPTPLRRIALPLLLLAAAGCAQAPRATNIVPSPPVAVSQKHQTSVRVEVTGGGKEWRLSDEALRDAIVAAIEESGLFEKASADGTYRLDVVVGSVRQPPVGWNFTVDVETIWNLSRTDTKETIWQETVKGQGTRTPADAFAAVNRLRMATEAAAQDCVAQGIRRLSEVSLPAR